MTAKTPEETETSTEITAAEVKVGMMIKQSPTQEWMEWMEVMAASTKDDVVYLRCRHGEAALFSWSGMTTVKVLVQ